MVYEGLSGLRSKTGKLDDSGYPAPHYSHSILFKCPPSNLFRFFSKKKNPIFATQVWKCDIEATENRIFPIYCLHFNFIPGYLQSFSRKYTVMRVCDLTGKRPMVGNNVSHSNRKTKRRFYPNLQEKKFFIPEENRWIVMKVSTKAIKTINKKGITAVLNDYIRNGQI